MAANSITEIKINLNTPIVAKNQSVGSAPVAGPQARALQNLGYCYQNPGNASAWLADLGRLALLGLVNSFGQISQVFGIDPSIIAAAENYLEAATPIVQFEERSVGGTVDAGLESLIAIAGSEPKQIVDISLGRLAILENGNHILYTNKPMSLERACGALSNEELRQEISTSIPEVEDGLASWLTRKASKAYHATASRAPISWLAWLLQIFGVSHSVMESAENYVRDESQSQLQHIFSIEERLGRGEQIGGIPQSLSRKPEIAQMAAESPQGETAVKAYTKLQSLLKGYWHKVVDGCGQGRPVRNEAEKLSASFLLLDYLGGQLRQETMKVDLARALYLRELSEDDETILGDDGNGRGKINPRKYLEERMANHMSLLSYIGTSLSDNATQLSQDDLLELAAANKKESERYLRAISALENLQQVEEGMQSQALEKRLGVLADARDGLIDGFVYSITPEQYAKIMVFVRDAVGTFKKQAGLSLRPTFVGLIYKPRAAGSQNYAPLGFEEAELVVGRPHSKDGVITTHYQRIPLPRNLYRTMNAIVLDSITGPAGVCEMPTLLPWEPASTHIIDANANVLKTTNTPENTESLKTKA